MSADNGIYILQSSDGYRVIHTQAIENLWWWGDEPKTESEINPKYLKSYFGKAPTFKTRNEAWDEALRMYNEIMNGDFPILEYGICIIPGWEDKPFPE